MRVLSLFDGCSGGQQALKMIGITPSEYYASEVDKYAMQVTKNNFPNTIFIGDVRAVNGLEYGAIQILQGGSPCHSFSFAGKRKGMSTTMDIEITELEQYLKLKEQGFEFQGQSYLFWEYIRILGELREENPNIKFLLENVMMEAKWKAVISKALGINPIRINANLVSGQNRDRYYWTNIGAEQTGLFGHIECVIPQPKDRGILLKDILEEDVADKYFLSDKILDFYTSNSKKQEINNSGFGFTPIKDFEKKSKSITTKSGSRMEDNYIVAQRGRQDDGGNYIQEYEPRTDGKTNTLTSVQKDNLVAYGCDYRKDEGFRVRKEEKSNTLMARAREDAYGTGLVKTYGNIRRLTPIECERIQCMEDDFTKGVSDSQRYKMIGNGWCISVIAHIFKHLNQTE